MDRSLYVDRFIKETKVELAVLLEELLGLLHLARLLAMAMRDLIEEAELVIVFAHPKARASLVIFQQIPISVTSDDEVTKLMVKEGVLLLPGELGPRISVKGDASVIASLNPVELVKDPGNPVGCISIALERW